MLKNKNHLNAICGLIIATTIFLPTCSASNKITKSHSKSKPTKIVFANTKQAIDILSKEDNYIKGLSKFDYASKMKSSHALNLNERKALYSKAVLSWNNTEKERVKNSANEILKKIKGWNLNLPSKIVFITTNGNEEGNASYTRTNAITLPKTMLKYYENPKDLEGLIAHELFHVYSRYNKNLRDKMYGIIHFKKCAELQFPKEIKDLKISNPDAPANNYYINATYKNKLYSFIPIIYSSKPYDIKSNASFFQSLKEGMLAVKIVNSKPQTIYENGSPLIVSKDQLADFYKQIGKNTNYTYHPEETMADNFELLVLGEKVPSKWVLDDLKKVICR
jgi:hypothetical protein